MMNAPLQFNPIPYPLWRRAMPAPLKAALYPLWRHWMDDAADTNPPTTPDALAVYLLRWGLLSQLGMTADDARRALEQDTGVIESVREDVEPPAAADTPVRLPAQWEQMEAVILAFPVLYPFAWQTHAQMAEAISAVAKAIITVPSPLWGRAVRLYLSRRGLARMDNIRLLHLPTDDIWVRDYGPFVGLDEFGQQAVIDLIYDPLPKYPQTRDNAMPLRWAAHDEIPARRVELRMEGGNVWSDGAGTLIMTEDLYGRNPELRHEEVERRLRAAFRFDKLIILPPLRWEETNHVDLVVKLADAQTLLISAPTSRLNAGRLREATAILQRETNAAGQPYRIHELPLPPFYLNWGAYSIWRPYTNALTVNGCVLVPVFGVPTDAEALRVYRKAMPGHEVIPIDCAMIANGGGAVHCLTKEVPKAQKI